MVHRVYKQNKMSPITFLLATIITYNSSIKALGRSRSYKITSRFVGKAIFCEEKGLKGQAENMRRLSYFSYLELEIQNPTEDKLLEKIEPRLLSPKDIDVLEIIIENMFGYLPLNKFCFQESMFNYDILLNNTYLQMIKSLPVFCNQIYLLSSKLARGFVVVVRMQGIFP